MRVLGIVSAVVFLACGPAPGSTRGTVSGLTLPVREVTLQDLQVGMTVNVTDIVRASCSDPYRSARMLSFLFANKDSVPMKEGDRVTHRGARFATTGRDCTATLLLDSDEGWAQLDRLARDPRTNALEAELSFSFRFGEETLEGTVRGRSCPREAGFNRCTED